MQLVFWPTGLQAETKKKVKNSNFESFWQSIR